MKGNPGDESGLRQLGIKTLKSLKPMNGVLLKHTERRSADVKRYEVIQNLKALRRAAWNLPERLAAFR